MTTPSGVVAITASLVAASRRSAKSPASRPSNATGSWSAASLDLGAGTNDWLTLVDSTRGTLPRAHCCTCAHNQLAFDTCVPSQLRDAGHHEKADKAEKEHASAITTGSRCRYTDWIS